MADTTERVELGVCGDKTYYWNKKTDSLEWSVPSPRAAVMAEPGRILVAADYSQIEVKLMAYMSGDPILIEAINSGLDVHSFNATVVFGERYNFTYELMELARNDESHPRHNELSLIRSRIKTVTFGVPYGAGPERVALMTGMSIEEAEAFIEDFFTKFKVLKAWLEKSGAFALNEGYSATPRGRKRWYTLPDPSDPDRKKIESQIRRWAGNMPIQGGNADILKIAMYLIYKKLRGGSVTGKKIYDARFLLVVHDEIVLDCAEKDYLAVKEIMCECMTEAYHMIVPTKGFAGWVALGPEKHNWKVEVKGADTWAKAK